MPKDLEVQPEESTFKLYLSGAIGAFCLGFGDLINNDKAATVLKVSEVIKQNLIPGFEGGALIAFAALMIISGLLCWVHPPQSRIEAFTRGFSVFAVLAVVSPYQNVPKGLERNHDVRKSGDVSFYWISSAYAKDEAVVKGPNDGNAVANPPVSITLLPADATDNDPKSERLTGAVVTVREITSGKVVGADAVGKTFSVKQPNGRYLIEIESAGFERSAAEVEVNGHAQSINVPVERSKIPLSIQRLYGAKRVVGTP